MGRRAREERRKKRLAGQGIRLRRELLPEEREARRQRRKARREAKKAGTWVPRARGARRIERHPCTVQGHQWADKPTRVVPRLEGSLLPAEVWVCPKCAFTVCSTVKPHFSENSTGQSTIQMRRTTPVEVHMERTKGVNGMEATRPDHREMKLAARELNRLLGLRPPIDTSQEDLEDPLREAIGLLRDGDKLTDETQSVVDYFVPEKKKEESAPMARTAVKEKSKEPEAKKEKEAKKEAPSTPKGMLTVAEAAEKFEVSKRLLRRAARKDQLASEKNEAGRVLFKEKDVAAFLKEQEKKGKSEKEEEGKEKD